VPRVCTICTDERVEAINLDLVRREPFRHIASRFDVGYKALHRHAHDHLPALLVKAHEAEEKAEADALLSRVEVLHSRTLAVLEAAEGTEDHRLALAAIREARGNLQLIGEVSKQLDRQPVVNLNLSAEWLEIRAVIVGALDGFPEARESLLSALDGEVSATG
jgi:hypothetical protein